MGRDSGQPPEIPAKQPASDVLSKSQSEIQAAALAQQKPSFRPCSPSELSILPPPPPRARSLFSTAYNAHRRLSSPSSAGVLSSPRRVRLNGASVLAWGSHSSGTERAYRKAVNSRAKSGTLAHSVDYFPPSGNPAVSGSRVESRGLGSSRFQILQNPVTSGGRVESREWVGIDLSVLETALICEAL
ncbi:hypothetical protein SCHPADRAFT_944700 [Schizopora paradoxa]|uniref:Uncharacterized protein n=1 Tax=Schizopora paradoxa TaxID=27342 RepID=A0A0H2R9R8_9AGAM|nr:hypothetical protein SCHPADRAFT_944700 [Schizopora paradoxa]